MVRCRASRGSLSLAVLMLAGFPVGHHDAAGATARRAASPRAVAVLAGGCYWGVESVFRHVTGINSATSGYATPVPAGGADSAPPAEAVRLVYDSTRISYGQILDVFFSVVHDPTQLNRQGPDVGTEYRSIVFVQDDGQQAVVQSYMDSLAAAHVYPRPIVTQVARLRSFEAVGPGQQDYAAHHPTDPYIVANDAPKLEALSRRFPGLYRS